MDSNYDVVVIGCGPGGYKCAIRAAQLGLKVACVDKNEVLGGTCLREGCIPSKALLSSSYQYYNAKNHLPNVGVNVDKLTFDLPKMMEFKDKNVKELSAGIEFLFKKNKIDKLLGIAEILSFNKDKFSISVVNNNENTEIKTKNIVISTGSEITSLPNIVIDEKNIVSSTGALQFSTVPKKMAVIGAGAIGLEMSSVWSRLGSEVTVIEFMDKIASSMDGDLSKALLASLKKQNINFMLSSKVIEVNQNNDVISVKIESVSDQNKQEIIEVDKLLVSVGRRPFIDGLVKGEKFELDDKGFIKVDKSYQTNIPGIYAIGDVIGGIMLAHKAEEEGISTAEIIAGQLPHLDYSIIPSVIYTHPAAASIGRTEEQLKKEKYPYKIGKSNFSANSRSKTTNDTEGFVKVIACKKSDTILGVHILGAYADTLINEASVAMAYGASCEDIYRICHSHPDVNEAFRDAAEDSYLK